MQASRDSTGRCLEPTIVGPILVHGFTLLESPHLRQEDRILEFVRRGMSVDEVHRARTGDWERRNDGDCSQRGGTGGSARRRCAGVRHCMRAGPRRSKRTASRKETARSNPKPQWDLAITICPLHGPWSTLRGQLDRRSALQPSRKGGSGRIHDLLGS